MASAIAASLVTFLVNIFSPNPNTFPMHPGYGLKGRDRNQRCVSMGEKMKVCQCLRCQVRRRI